MAAPVPYAVAKAAVEWFNKELETIFRARAPTEQRFDGLIYAVRTLESEFILPADIASSVVRVYFGKKECAYAYVYAKHDPKTGLYTPELRAFVDIEYADTVLSGDSIPMFGYIFGLGLLCTTQNFKGKRLVPTRCSLIDDFGLARLHWTPDCVTCVDFDGGKRPWVYKEHCVNTMYLTTLCCEYEPISSVEAPFEAFL